MSLREMLGELVSSGTGKAGVTLFAVLAAVSIYVLVAYPLDFGTTRWGNPAVWADNPKAAPPAWTNWLTGESRFEHTVLEAEEPTGVSAAGPGEIRTYDFPVEVTYDEPPTFMTIALGRVTYERRPPVLEVLLERPDGTTVTLHRAVVRGPRPGEEPPFRRYQDSPLRVQLSTERTAISQTARMLGERYGVHVGEEELGRDLPRALFGVPSEGTQSGFEMLPGVYHVVVRATTGSPGDRVGRVEAVLGGSVFGWMGTDTIGRDLVQGLLYGFPIGLLIAVSAAVLTTIMGAGIGIISGYLGGATDMVLQRLADLVSNVPVLPLLIFLVFILGSNLFLIILVLVAFSWPSLAILVRSMVLQIRSGQLIEAARTVGASKWRVMYRHVFPHTAPFVFAQMIFFAPSAILAEAALSFLGLGDPSLPTWGQILEAGFRTGAVYVGYWWWIVPPGILIVVTAMAFMFIALATEPVVNPRLRRML